jgi:hypothetical protein
MLRSLLKNILGKGPKNADMGEMGGPSALLKSKAKKFKVEANVKVNTK